MITRVRGGLLVELQTGSHISIMCNEYKYCERNVPLRRYEILLCHFFIHARPSGTIIRCAYDEPRGIEEVVLIGITNFSEVKIVNCRECDRRTRAVFTTVSVLARATPKQPQ